MKKLLFIAMACVLSIGLIGGAFAYFNDTETSTGNTFTAGSLDLKVGGMDGPLPTIMSYGGDGSDNVYPGWSYTYTAPITNVGSISGYADLMLTSIVDDNNGTAEPEGNSTGDLSANTLITISYDPDGAGPAVPVVVQSATPLNTLLNVDIDASAVLPATTGAASWIIYASVPTSVGNSIMTDSVICTIVFGLDQVAD